jgi:A/G-specific adenine glycosylase
MGKRKQPETDYYSGDEDSDSSSASTWKPSKKTGFRPRRTKQELAVNHSDSNNQQSGKEDDQHPASRHLITSPGPICTALLDWYAGVHESRGMPWRKPFDNSLDPEIRGQRAYEVNFLQRLLCTD